MPIFRATERRRAARFWDGAATAKCTAAASGAPITASPLAENASPLNDIALSLVENPHSHFEKLIKNQSHRVFWSSVDKQALPLNCCHHKTTIVLQRCRNLAAFRLADGTRATNQLVYFSVLAPRIYECLELA
jgi:hypothetical protein